MASPDDTVKGPTLADVIEEYELQDPSPQVSEEEVSRAARTLAERGRAAKGAAQQAAGVQAPPPQPPRPKHPDWLVKKAEAAGVHPVILEMLDSERLSQVVMDSLTAARKEAAATSLERQMAAPRGQPPEAASTPAPGQPSLAEEFDWGEYEEEDEAGAKVKRKASRDDVHPLLASVIERQAKEIAELKKFVMGVTQQQRAAEARSVDEQLDAAFNRRPELFGKGSLKDVKGTPGYHRRAAVYQQVMAIPREQRAGMSVEQAVEQVTRMLFEVGGRQEAVERWNEGALAAPTQRRAGAEPPGRNKAIQSVAEYQREQRMTPEDLDTSYDEFLP